MGGSGIGSAGVRSSGKKEKEESKGGEYELSQLGNRLGTPSTNESNSINSES